MTAISSRTALWNPQGPQKNRQMFSPEYANLKTLFHLFGLSSLEKGLEEADDISTGEDLEGE